MIETIPLPAMDGPFEEPFWQSLKIGTLSHQQCQRCLDWHFPARWRCHCGGSLEYRPVSGKATLWSWTVVHAPVLPVFAAYTPFVSAVAELEEAPNLRMVGTLIMVDGDPINRVQSADLHIGMALTCRLSQIAPNTIWPVWKID